MKKIILIAFLIFLFVSCSYNNFKVFTHNEPNGFTNYYLFERSENNVLNEDLIIYLDGASFHSTLGIKGSILPWKSFSLAHKLQKELPNKFDLLVPDKMNINTGEDFSEDSLKLSYTNLEARVNSAVSSIDEFLVNHKYKNIYLIGFSEGGMILPKVYNTLNNKNEISKLVNLSGGGYSYYTLIKNYYRERGLDTLKVDSVYSDILKNPNSLSKFYMGHPYKQWTDFMKYEPSLEYKNINIPVLILQGSNDENLPVASSLYLKNYLNDLGKKNVTYLELEKMDHSYSDDFESVITIISNWLSK
jgi:predicted esterase